MGEVRAMSGRVGTAKLAAPGWHRNTNTVVGGHHHDEVEGLLGREAVKSMLWNGISFQVMSRKKTREFKDELFIIYLSKTR